MRELLLSILLAGVLLFVFSFSRVLAEDGGSFRETKGIKLFFGSGLAEICVELDHFLLVKPLTVSK